MVHPSESHTLKTTERNLLPSGLPEVLCRPQRLWCRCTPNTVSCPFLIQIAALKNKKGHFHTL